MRERVMAQEGRITALSHHARSPFCSLNPIQSMRWNALTFMGSLSLFLNPSFLFASLKIKLKTKQGLRHS